MRKAILLAGLLVLLAAQPPSLHAQGFWVKKDFQEWSKSDCQKLLNDSPWAKAYRIGTVVFQTVQEESVVPGRGVEPQITYQARLMSARPIRQALVRLNQLDPKYRELTPEQKQARDEQLAKFIQAEFPDTILVQLLYTTNSPTYDRQLARHWQTQPIEDLKKSFWLIGAPGRINPVGVSVAPGAGGEIQLVFPRVFEGQPVVGPNVKYLGIEFPHPSIEVLPAEKVYIQFDVKKMKLGDAVVY